MKHNHFEESELTYLSRYFGVNARTAAQADSAGKSFPEIGYDRQHHPWPRTTLRRRLRARPLTPTPGTLPNAMTKFDILESITKRIRCGSGTGVD